MFTSPKKFENCPKISIVDGQPLFVAEITQDYIDECFLCLGPTELKPSEFLALLGPLIAKEKQSLVAIGETWSGSEGNWMYVAVNSYRMEQIWMR